MHTPDNEDLLQAIRRRLGARVRELETEIIDKSHELALDLDLSAQLASIGGDDRRNARTQTELEQAERERDEIELAAVRSALARIDAGRYGRCSDCGQSIDAARLQAQPAAQRCTICQRALERLRTA